MPAAASSVITIYGISNCDQCRKAKSWLNAQQQGFHFHDVRADGLTQMHLDQWFKHLPWDTLLNKRGTTWRQLPEDQRKAVVDQASAGQAIVLNPTLMKRPVLTVGDTVLVGFNPDLWSSLLTPNKP
jgi:arsenate reductase (glutaredoxin)